jgi:hypothetical protein
MWSRNLAQPKKINWRNALAVISLGVLVGTELVGMTWAAGWALGGIFDLPPLFRRIFEGVGFVLGCIGLYYFMRSALKVEPIRE